jgi:hypothetical protein
LECTPFRFFLMLLKELVTTLRAIYLVFSNFMNLYIVKPIASVSETSVSISLQSVMLKAIAELLANPTCRVSFTSVIFICFFI